MDIIEPLSNICMIMSTNNTHKVKLMGQRILSEANDLKRTLSALAGEINRSEDLLKGLLVGRGSVEEALDVAREMSNIYPIDLSRLIVDLDENVSRIKIMRKEESLKSSRVFDRLDSRGARTRYYEYRDCALTKLSPFRPEWIKELRIVTDDDPYNPDVAYNNGHLMHQMTAFIGPVNFYWEVDGQKFMKKMTTGDSNFITPFWAHSFTSRNRNEEAIIIAVTFSGEVGRARNELYAIGDQKISSYSFDARDPRRGTSRLVRLAMGNLNLTIGALKTRIFESGANLDLDTILNPKVEKTRDDIFLLSEIMGVPFDCLFVSEYDPSDEVVVKKKISSDSYIYTESDTPDYEISPLAKLNKMPLANGFNIKVISSSSDVSGLFESSLHDFVYNYGESPIMIQWADQKNEFLNDIIYPGDSISIQPFVKYCFWNLEGYSNGGELFVFRVPGAINIHVQKELSSFANNDRIIESSSWFN